VESRRAQLARLLARRRRRARLLLVCVATAVACGSLAGVVGPKVLIGGTGAAPPEAELVLPEVTLAPRGGESASTEATGGPLPLDLAECLGLDPRQEQANAVRWHALSPERRRALLDLYWRLAEMDEAQRRELLERYSRFRDLPEGRRRALRERARRLRAFLETLSPQDQAVLESLDPQARARRILRLWQARYGT